MTEQSERQGHAERGRRESLAHVDALDGIRGLAVLGVLFFHFGHLQGGFLGVDLFFVLSGFLITGLLLAEHRTTGGIALGAFWARRARRLLPALLLLIVGISLYAIVVAQPGELHTIRRDALATLGYVANWVQIAAGVSYWDAFSAPSPLEHTWSLAIEEQFYLVWPLIVFGVLRLTRGSTKAVGWVSAGLAVVSLATFAWFFEPGGDPSRVYFGSDTRAAALLYGAIAATFFARRAERDRSAVRSRAMPIFVAAWVVLLGWSWIVATGASEWLYRWGFPLTGITTAVAIYCVAVGRGGPAGVALAWRPLCHVGIISYGLYLWHWPIDVALTPTRTHLHGWALTALQLAVTFAVAEASFYLVERPIRRGAWRGWRIRLATPAAFAIAATCVVFATAGYVPRYAGDVADGITLPSSTPPIADALRIMVVGDSGAAYLGPGMADVSGELQGPNGAPVQVGAYGTVGCGLPRDGDGVFDGDNRLLADPPGCHDWATRWADQVGSFRPQMVVLELAWPGIGDRPLNGQRLHPCDAAFDDYYKGEVGAAISTLGAQGAIVLVATAPYVGVPGADPSRVDCLNRTYRAAVAEHPGAKVLDLASWLCNGADCRTAIGPTTLRPDGVHFEGEGAKLAGRFVLREAFRLVGQPAVDPASPGRVLLLGDSTAFRFGGGFPRLQPPPFTLDQSTKRGCGLVPGLVADTLGDPDTCDDLLDEWRSAVNNVHPDVILLMTGAWEVLDHQEGDHTVRFGTPEWHDLLASSLDAFYADVAGSTPVVLLNAPCFEQAADAQFPATARNDPARVAAWNDLEATAAAHHPGSRVADLHSYLCPGEHDVGTIDGVKLRYDGVHLTDEGAEVVWRWLSPQLLATIPAR